MAHEYVGELLNNGTTSSDVATMSLENNSGNQLGADKTDIGKTINARPDPAGGKPRIEFSPGGDNKFDNDGTASFSDEPLKLTVDIGSSSFKEQFDIFSFTTDTNETIASIAIGSASLTYGGNPGVPGIVDAGGVVSSPQFKFRLLEGTTILAQTFSSSVGYSATVSSISTNANIEFTNDTSGVWNPDALRCEVEDSGGTFREIDEVTFSPPEVGPNATIRFTDVTHNFVYP